MLESPGGLLTYLERALEDGHAEITGTEKSRRIIYRASGFCDLIGNPGRERSDLQLA
jgi:hypothetical protein